MGMTAMRCEDCQGQRRILAHLAQPGWLLVPCPSCNGSGITSCCEGACGNAADVTNTGETKTPAP